VGDVIDDMYGKGRSTDDVNSLKAAWDSVWDSITGAHDSSISLSTVWGTAVSFLKTSWGDLVDSVLTTLTLIMRAGDYMKTLVSGTDKQKADAKSALGTAWDKANLTGLLRINPIGEIGNVINDAAKGRFDTGYAGKIEPGKKYTDLPEGATIRDFAGTGTKHGGNVTNIQQTNNIQGGDPDKIKNAIHQGTSSALSQGDLRNTQRAVASRAPSQGGESFVP
jgi:hypothetical protein